LDHTRKENMRNDAAASYSDFFPVTVRRDSTLWIIENLSMPFISVMTEINGIAGYRSREYCVNAVIPLEIAVVGQGKWRARWASLAGSGLPSAALRSSNKRMDMRDNAIV